MPVELPKNRISVHPRVNTIASWDDVFTRFLFYISSSQSLKCFHFTSVEFIDFVTPSDSEYAEKFAMFLAGGAKFERSDRPQRPGFRLMPVELAKNQISVHTRVDTTARRASTCHLKLRVTHTHIQSSVMTKATICGAPTCSVPWPSANDLATARPAWGASQPA